MQELTGKHNIEGREEEGCLINSLDASYVLFKRGVTTIYDRGCGLWSLQWEGRLRAWRWSFKTLLVSAVKSSP